MARTCVGAQKHVDDVDSVTQVVTCHPGERVKCHPGRLVVQVKTLHVDTANDDNDHVVQHCQRHHYQPLVVEVR